MTARTEGERPEIRGWISSGSIYKVIFSRSTYKSGPRGERQVAGLVQSESWSSMTMARRRAKGLGVLERKHIK